MFGESCWIGVNVTISGKKSIKRFRELAFEEQVAEKAILNFYNVFAGAQLRKINGLQPKICNAFNRQSPNKAKKTGKTAQQESQTALTKSQLLLKPGMCDRTHTSSSAMSL